MNPAQLLLRYQAQVERERAVRDVIERLESRLASDPEVVTQDGLDVAFLWDDDSIPRFSADRARRIDQDHVGALDLRSVATQRKIGETLRHEGGIGSAAFHPSGTTVVTGGADRRVRTWDIDSGRSMGVSGHG